MEGTGHKIAELTEKKAAMEKQIATCEEYVKALQMKMDDVKARMDEKDIEIKELKRQQVCVRRPISLVGVDSTAYLLVVFP